MRWPWCWPLLAMPIPVIGYVLSVVAVDLALAGWDLASMRPRAADVVLFALLMACGAMCIEVTRRLGQPSGISRDLLSAWWLPVALLLPSLALCAFALAAATVMDPPAAAVTASALWLLPVLLLTTSHVPLARVASPAQAVCAAVLCASALAMFLRRDRFELG